jgi:integrase
VDDTFPTITPHDLRHTAASLAVSARANVKAVQRMLGHAKASMTLDTGDDLFDEDLDEVADRLNAAITATADALRTAQK